MLCYVMLRRILCIFFHNDMPLCPCSLFTEIEIKIDERWCDDWWL